MNSKSILIVDDEQSIREMLRLTLEYEHYQVFDVPSGYEALRFFERTLPDVVILDVKMSGMDGMETLDRIKEIAPHLPVILLTGHGTIETAVEATKKGAFDFLSKPPDREKFLITIRHALMQTQLVRENRAMRAQIDGIDSIIGSSKQMLYLLSTVERVAPTEAYILITGENGTGKELIAKALHRGSTRNEQPLIEVNCAAIPTELIESELFGHEKGSFTGATSQRIGKFEAADNGTLLLDEIGDMSLAAQAKVLRVLEEGTFERLGGSKQIQVDVRVIAATNKNLAQEIKEGHFREDLYHRLNVIPLHIPALRERREDIPLLINHFLADSCRRNKLPHREIAEEAIRRLCELSWPGNVRELRNAIERLVILVPQKIMSHDVDTYVLGQVDEFQNLLSQHITFQEFKDRSEEMFLRKQLEFNEWNVSKTAESLDIQRSHMYNKIKRYNFDRRDVGE